MSKEYNCYRIAVWRSLTKVNMQSVTTQDQHHFDAPFKGFKSANTSYKFRLFPRQDEQINSGLCPETPRSFFILLKCTLVPSSIPHHENAGLCLDITHSIILLVVFQFTLCSKVKVHGASDPPETLSLKSWLTVFILASWPIARLSLIKCVNVLIFQDKH